MDLHIVPGVTAREAAHAHLLDVNIQEQYCCKAMTYWIDEDKGAIFCLIEAPDKESVHKMHENAHGLVPHEIIPVNVDVVKAFLGRVNDPADAIRQPGTDLKIFSDPAFRIIMVTKATDARLLQQRVGKERAKELLLLYSTIVREQAGQAGGSEVYQREEGLVISFTSAARATECATAIGKRLSGAAGIVGITISLNAGVPLNNRGNSIFEATIRFAQFLCSIHKPAAIVMSAVVRGQFRDHDWSILTGEHDIRSLGHSDETFLEAVADTLAQRWQDPEFDIPDFCLDISMSKSQLYRKSIALTGMSPKTLLREYRLLRSLELLRDESRNISQTTFDTGFSSPSYFTKCFQKRFGMQPLAYLKARV